MKREQIEVVLGRKVTDAEWIVACALLELIERHPNAEAGASSSPGHLFPFETLCSSVKPSITRIITATTGDGVRLAVNVALSHIPSFPVHEPSDLACRQHQSAPTVSLGMCRPVRLRT
jgi:hypothetical protein